MTRNLGVMFDGHLTWDSHVSALVRNATVFSSSCPTWVTRSFKTSYQRWSTPLRSHKTGIVPPSLEADGEKTCSVSKRSVNFLPCVASPRQKFDYISDVRELGWPTTRQLYEQHLLSFLLKIATTKSQKVGHLSFWSTLPIVSGPIGRTPI